MNEKMTVIDPVLINDIRYSDNLYVFKFDGNREVVAARAPASEMRFGEDPFSWIIGGPDRIKDDMSYYRQSKLVTKSFDGDLTLCPFAASASLGLALFGKPLKKDDVTSRVERFNAEMAEKGLEMSLTAAQVESAERKMYSMPKYFDAIFDGRFGDLPRDTRELIGAVAELAGCRPCISIETEIRNWKSDTTDIGLFVAFLLVILLFSRRVSDTRNADVIITRDEELGFAVKIEIPVSMAENIDIRELLALDEIASAKNIYFDYAVCEELIFVAFSPILRDKAFIELKSKFEFHWDK